MKHYFGLIKRGGEFVAHFRYYRNCRLVSSTEIVGPKRAKEIARLFISQTFESVII